VAKLQLVARGSGRQRPVREWRRERYEMDGIGERTIRGGEKRWDLAHGGILV
jgi:hypothetical protein